MTRRRHSFRSAGQDAIIAKALMRHALLNNPTTLVALNRYIASLCLKGRIATGQLSETEALIEFERAIHLFARKMHTELNKRWAQDNIDQTDLSIPINMQNALNNPLSTACTLMIDTAAAIESAVINESYQNEQVNAQTLQNSNQTADASEPKETEKNEIEKTATLIGAVTLFDEKGADAAKDKIESAFFKETGIKTEFHKEGPEEEFHSILQKVLKPEFRDYQNNDKDKG